MLSIGKSLQNIGIKSALLNMFVLVYNTVFFSLSLLRRRKLAEVERHEKLPAHPNVVKFIRAWEEK